jgi:hypothetical protein
MTDTAEVSTHFRIPLLSGQSTFTVRVPRHHLDGHRKFFFSQINLVPDYFSQDAQKQNLDADPDLEKMIEMVVYVKLNFGDPRTVYMQEPYSNPGTTLFLGDAMAGINTYFEKLKPDFAFTTPLFMDWIDLAAPEGQDINDYVPTMAPVFYGKAFNATEHQDFLPASARAIEGVNNFLPPLGIMPSAENFAKRIRLRFWMAPFTKVIFSSKDPFATDFGFLEDQIGTYHAQYKQYHLYNDKPYWLPVMIGKLAPKLKLTRPNFKMAVMTTTNIIEGSLSKIQMTKKDWLDNAKLLEMLKARFNQTSRMTNVVFSVGYDEAEKKFFFKFPDSEAVGVLIRCETDFAHRLGFGHVTTITKGMQAMPQEDQINIVDAKKKALSVVYDTGPILCTLDQMSSNTTSGALDQTMAALYPHESGILAMPQSVCSCSSNLTSIHPLTQTSAAHVPVTFRLLRIYEDQTISDFAWKCNAYVYGVLQGTCKKV